MTSATLATRLAEWAHLYEPTPAELIVAERALLDTVAVAYAARSEPLLQQMRSFDEAGLWATAAHALDFDDLHMESTAHISAVVVPVVLAVGGTLRDYLTGAGVAARVGGALGWSHYSSGWHSTCTAGAVGAAVAASTALGLDPTETAHAIVLAIPAVSGIQRAFGSDVKSLQVGYAADAGVRAAYLASDGARGNLEALETWMTLMGAESTEIDVAGPALVGGLALKLYPCGYAVQRVIACAREAFRGVSPDEIVSIRAITPEATVKPLIYHNPQTGVQGRFSLEYGIAAALLDDYPGFQSFADEAVIRPQAQSLMARVELTTLPGGDGLLSGSIDLELTTRSGDILRGSMSVPPGAPGRPPSDDDFGQKIADCGLSLGDTNSLSVTEAASLLRATFPAGRSSIRESATI